MADVTELTVTGARRRLVFKPVLEALEPRRLFSVVTVNTTVDVLHSPRNPTVSLRDAIAIANNSTRPVTIEFSAPFDTPQTITLNDTGLELSGKEPVTINGPAAGVTVKSDFAGGLLAGDNFFIDKGVVCAISNLTISGGASGINSSGTLTLNNVRLTGNGEGVFNFGDLVISNSTISNNDAGIYGNANGIDNHGTLKLTGSTVSNNKGGANGGGGIENESVATMTLTNDTISGNAAANSGGIDNQPFAIATITGVTVSDNSDVGYDDAGTTTPGLDGGIGNFGTMTVTDCTVTGNSSGSSGGGIGNHEILTLTDSTISGNTAGGRAFSSETGYGYAGGIGGGLYVDAASLATVISNSIVAGNNVLNGSLGKQFTLGTGTDVFGVVQSRGHNLIGQVNPSSIGWTSTDLIGTPKKPLNARLGPLANYGGPTQTISLLPGSPAIDAGFNALIRAGVTTDQRGLSRISGGAVDIGAFEVQVTPRVEGFRLLDAKTGKDFGSIANGQTISLSDLGINQLDIVAVVNPGAGSAAFSLDGHYVGSESLPLPFTLRRTGFKSPGGGLLPGVYTLIVQPFSLKYDLGTAGAFQAIHFTVVA